MSGPADPGSYCYGRKLLGRVGWEMYLGASGSGGERWEPITAVRIRGDHVLLTVADGTTYRAGYTDAVRCRRPGLPVARHGGRVSAAWGGRRGGSPRQADKDLITAAASRWLLPGWPCAHYWAVSR